MKNKIKSLLHVILESLYPGIDLKHYSPVEILKVAFFQKILGFNRHVPWPVHWSSKISAVDNIEPGTRTPGLSKNCHIDGRNGIMFGKNVWIGPDVKVISMNHDLNNYEHYIKANPIVIKDNCWIGAGSIILPEVELGEHTVVAAGAVVTKSFCEGNQVIGGNPAKVLKKLPNYGLNYE